MSCVGAGAAAGAAAMGDLGGFAGLSQSEIYEFGVDDMLDQAGKC